MKKFAVYSFFIFSMVCLLGNFMDNEWLINFTKPLLMLSLVAYYLLKRNNKWNLLTTFIFTALLFSWIGDILLLLKIDNSFLLGLFAFMITHIFYIFGFSVAINKGEKTSSRPFIHSRIALLLMIGLAMFYLLYPALGDMKWPVGIYTIVLVGMGLTALFRKDRTEDRSFIKVYSGGLLFIMSDALLGINYFLDPIPAGGLLIMFTYLLAQYLIVEGILNHENFISGELKERSE